MSVIRGARCEIPKESIKILCWKKIGGCYRQAEKMFRLHGLQGLLKHLKDCSKSSSERRVHMDHGQTQAIYAPGYGLNACVTSKCICQILLPLALVHCGSLEAQGRRTFKGVHWIGLSSRGWPVPTMPVHTPESQGPQQLLLSLKPVPGAWKVPGSSLEGKGSWIG